MGKKDVPMAPLIFMANSNQLGSVCLFVIFSFSFPPSFSPAQSAPRFMNARPRASGKATPPDLPKGDRTTHPLLLEWQKKPQRKMRSLDDASPLFLFPRPTRRPRRRKLLVVAAGLFPSSTLLDTRKLVCFLFFLPSLSLPKLNKIPNPHFSFRE